jgi:hypothetical protein
MKHFATLHDMYRMLIRCRVSNAVADSRLARQSSGFLDAMTGSGYANDWLSQTASDIFRIRKDHDEAAAWDAGFDGGEFSGPAHADMEIEEVERAEEHFFNYAGVQFSHAVRCRITPKSANRLGF